MVDRGALKDDLIRDEDIRLKPYVDTVGKLTIGIGRNLDDNGISEDEACYLLDSDINSIVNDLDRNMNWWRILPDDVQRALLNMCFNLGYPRLSGFKKMLAALEAGDYHKAADEALDSRWASQVGDRSKRIADLIRSGAET